MNEVIARKARMVTDYLQKEYEGYAELCGADDEISALPAKQALEAAKDVLAYLEQSA